MTREEIKYYLDSDESFPHEVDMARMLLEIHAALDRMVDDCPDCDGTGTVVRDKAHSDCDRCEGRGCFTAEMVIAQILGRDK